MKESSFLQKHHRWKLDNHSHCVENLMGKVPRKIELNEQLFPGSSEMAERMRSHNWAATSLGPPGTWPQSLRTVLQIMLTTQHAMFLWWGPDLVQFYNDGYRPSLGNDRHPTALGAHGQEFWHEIWPVIGPQVDRVMEDGESTWQEDALVPILRNGSMSDVYWTYSYSPILDDDGEVGGTLVLVQETTARVLSERRTELLRVLSEELWSERSSGTSIWEVASGVIDQHESDFAFVLFYAAEDGGRALRLIARAGEVPNALRIPEVFTVNAASADPLGLSLVLSGDEKMTVTDLGNPPKRLFSDRWPEPLEQIVSVPVSFSEARRPYGVLVAGLNPRISLDDALHNHLSLLASQIATTFANAQVFEDMRAAAAVKDQFLGLVSHELRSPISTLVGNTHLLLRRADRLSNEDRQESLEEILTSSWKLQEVIENLLTLTRMDASDALDLQPVSLKDLVPNCVESFSRRNPERTVSIDSNASSPEVAGQETLLAMVVDNLLSNANKYSPAGRPIEVRIETREREWVEVSVRDYGIGFNEADAEKLFTPFHRTTSGKAFAPGLGLGLAVCKRIIEVHGGQIWASRRLDGSDFRFSLPNLNH